ncbi:MAG: hypothetical protein DRR42_14715 [Gammaproteobacteria bacterium]|nr:MAG: hypothetical protein DRR42_14715 [Gammaproteobacteria bacterium]
MKLIRLGPHVGYHQGRDFIEPPKIPRVDILLDLVRKGSYPGAILEIPHQPGIVDVPDAGDVVEGRGGMACVECVGLVGAFWEEGGVVVDRDCR